MHQARGPQPFQDRGLVATIKICKKIPAFGTIPCNYPLRRDVKYLRFTVADISRLLTRYTMATNDTKRPLSRRRSALALHTLTPSVLLYRICAFNSMHSSVLSRYLTCLHLFLRDGKIQTTNRNKQLMPQNLVAVKLKILSIIQIGTDGIANSINSCLIDTFNEKFMLYF